MEVADVDEDEPRNGVASHGTDVFNNIENDAVTEDRAGEDIDAKGAEDARTSCELRMAPDDEITEVVLVEEQKEVVLVEEQKEDHKNSIFGQNGKVGQNTNGSSMLPIVQELFSREADRSRNDSKGAEDGGENSGIVSDWANWKPSSNDSRRVEEPWSIPQGSTWQAWDWDWKRYIHIKDATVRVQLSGCSVSDSDLPSLLETLHPVMQRQKEKTKKEHADWNIDLTCNSSISDKGVTDYLVPFLQQWPACSRLKLYKTSIGDKALESLGPWISQGHAKELHLSDLHRPISSEAAYNLLKQVHDSGHYPYKSDGKEKGYGSLWLRLEHNGIRNPESIVKKGRSEGMSLNVIEQEQLRKFRPTDIEAKIDNCPAVRLVLFHAQGVREPRRKGKPDVDYVDSTDWNADATDWNAEADNTDWPATKNDWHANGSSHSAGRKFNGSHKNHEWLEEAKHDDSYVNDSSWYGQLEMQPEHDEHRTTQLIAAREVLDAIDVRVREADPEVLRRWHEYLEYWPDPVSEATRIARMVGGLCSQGYNGSWGGASPSLKPSHPAGLSLASNAIRASAETVLSSAARNSEDTTSPTHIRPLVSEIATGSPSASLAVATSSGDDSQQKKTKKGKNKISSQGPPDPSSCSETPTVSTCTLPVLGSIEEPVLESTHDNTEEPVPIIAEDSASQDPVENGNSELEHPSPVIPEDSETTCEQ